MAKKRRGRSAAFMRSINPHLRNKRNSRKLIKGGNYMARKRHYRRSTSSSMGGKAIWSSVIGVGAYSLVWEPFVAPMIPLSGTTESLVELALGAFLMKKRGIVGDVAKAAVVINSYKLMTTTVRPMIIGH
jgi:hypothetical protein